METSLPPSQVTTGQPGKRVVVARQQTAPRAQRPRMVKRLFLVFCVIFGIVVFKFITGGN